MKVDLELTSPRRSHSRVSPLPHHHTPPYTHKGANAPHTIHHPHKPRPHLLPSRRFLPPPQHPQFPIGDPIPDPTLWHPSPRHPCPCHPYPSPRSPRRSANSKVFPNALSPRDRDRLRRRSCIYYGSCAVYFWEGRCARIGDGCE